MNNIFLCAVFCSLHLKSLTKEVHEDMQATQEVVPSYSKVKKYDGELAWRGATTAQRQMLSMSQTELTCHYQLFETETPQTLLTANFPTITQRAIKEHVRATRAVWLISLCLRTQTNQSHLKHSCKKSLKCTAVFTLNVLHKDFLCQDI